MKESVGEELHNTLRSEYFINLLIAMGLVITLKKQI